MYYRKQIKPLIIIMLLLLLGAASQVNAAEDPRKLAVLIILDRINIEDITDDYPNLQELIHRGAAGLMNIRTAGSYNPASGYLTFGAAARAAVVAGKAEKIFAYDESFEGDQAGKVYENLTGIKPLPQNILVLDIPTILTENRKQDHKVIPGLMGEVLKQNNIKVTLLGNGDTTNKKDRSSALIAMDQTGIVPRGNVDQSILTKDLQSPFLLKTNYNKLLELFNEIKEGGGLVIIQLGDTIRADEYSDLVSPPRGEYFKKKTLSEVDEFLGKLLRQIDLNQNLLMIATPFPSKTGYNNRNLLTPFLIAGRDIKPGLAFTPTTRRNGIVTNLDLAPTILSFFELEVPSPMLGYPVSSKEAVDTLPKLMEMNRLIRDNYVQRAYLIKPFVALQIIISFVYLLLFFTKNEWLKLMKPFIAGSMTIPLVLLILSYFTSLTSDSLSGKYIWMLILTTFFTFLLLRFNNSLKAVAAISLITSTAILLDLSLGANLIKVSALGYDPIGGSRYYGIGNEYMGILIGAIIVGSWALMDAIKAKRRFALTVCSLLFATCFYLIFSPKYGSNVGGTISAFGAFTITLLLAGGIKIRIRHLLALGVVLVISILFLFLYISKYTPPSHISKTVELVKDGGGSALMGIFSRKIAMNYKLLRYTVWTRALLASIIVITALLYRPPYFLKRIFNKYKYLYSGFWGTGAGCLLALVFNDSGIVAAATMMIFIALPILLFVIEEV
ncbi:MAG: hypothetical protein ACOYVD_04210 [Bacillota bacterium]